jgi:glycosyltransferase involved in cell wall biosynthesis
MTTASGTLVTVHSALGDYRQVVMEQLCEALPGRFHVFAGPDSFAGDTQTKLELGDNLTIVKNHMLFGRRFLWQSGMWRDVLRADVAIMEFNPRVLSVWPLLLVRKLLRKRTVLWGHAWPRLGREANLLPRAVMGRLADAIVVYTESQARELREFLPGKPVFAAPNALYSASNMDAACGHTTPTDFIYVGRLSPDKKPDLLLKAFIQAGDRLPRECGLIVVGDGSLRDQLMQTAKAEAGDRRIEFPGHVADQARLKELYARSLASVSPGYVGLSVTQSFSFGVPMIIARNEPHAPEIEAAIESKNCVTFDENDAGALADALVDVWNQRDKWTRARPEIVKDCAERYSVEVMVSGLLAGAFGNAAA